MLTLSRYTLVFTLLVLGACAAKESPEAQHARALAAAASIVPSDERLADLYQRSCKLCHAVENSGAPLVRDESQWEVRWKKGMPTLLKNVVAGVNGMPAGGQCFACTAADYEALIKFMAAHD